MNTVRKNFHVMNDLGACGRAELVQRTGAVERYPYDCTGEKIKVRMRFPAQALEELRKDDPDTPVTLNLIRTLARRGVIPSVKVGRGRLINYDALIDFLAHPTEGEPEQRAHGIRRVDERAGA